jgi:hypothetical protein
LANFFSNSPAKSEDLENLLISAGWVLRLLIAESLMSNESDDFCRNNSDGLIFRSKDDEVGFVVEVVVMVVAGSLLLRDGGDAFIGTVGGSMKFGATRRGNFGGGLKIKMNFIFY